MPPKSDRAAAFQSTANFAVDVILMNFGILCVTIPIQLSLRIGGLEDLSIQKTRLEIQAWKILTLS